MSMYYVKLFIVKYLFIFCMLWIKFDMIVLNVCNICLLDCIVKKYDMML